LIALKEAATTDANLMERLIACARARCTEGEIVGALASVFGTYRETSAF
jgi:(2R)-ethylmalonyl-CoA mutase